jgi:hypothetical protein
MDVAKNMSSLHEGMLFECGELVGNAVNAQESSCRCRVQLV